jgi:hypothetical protein
MFPTSVASVSSCKKVFSVAPTPVGLVASLFNESVPSHGPEPILVGRKFSTGGNRGNRGEAKAFLTDLCYLS